MDKNGQKITKNISYRFQFIEKVTEIYLAESNLLIAQELWQANCQILSIIFLKEFIKLNVNTDTMIKNVKIAELNVNIATASLNTQTLNNI